MKRIKSMEWLEETKIDKEAYVGFHLYMQTNFHELEEVLNQKGALSPAEFTNLINRYVTGEYKVTRDEIKVVTQLLDVDDSGFL